MDNPLIDNSVLSAEVVYRPGEPPMIEVVCVGDDDAQARALAYATQLASDLPPISQWFN